MAADDPPPPDTPVGVRRWARSDWTRRLFLLSASSGALVFSLGSTSYRWMVDGVDAADLLVSLYWLLPVVSLVAIPVDWHLTTTLLLLLPSISRSLSPSVARQALASVLFLIAGSARRVPETRFEPSSSIALMTDNDDGLDGRLDEDTEEIRYLVERSGRGNVGGDASSSVFGQLLFWWPTPLLRLSNSLPILHPFHLPHLPPELRSSTIFTSAKVQRMQERLLSSAKDNGKDKHGWKRLVKELWVLNKRSLFLVMVLALVKALVTFVPAFLLSRLIRSLEGSPDATTHHLQLWLCAGLALSSAFSGIIQSHLSCSYMTKVLVPVTIQLRTLLFTKTLRRKDVVEVGEGAGKSQIFNLFTEDVSRVANIGQDASGVTVAVIDLIIGTTLLYSLLGPSAFCGIALNFCTIPFNKALASVTFDVDRRRALARDRRVAALDEVLMGIRAVKYEAGEDHWEAKLSGLRDDEVYLQRLRYWMGTAYNLIWGSVPIFSLLATFFAFSKFQQGRLTPSIAFPALTVFNSLTQVWTILPGTWIHVTEALVSLKRLAGYLEGSEVDPVAPATPQQLVQIDEDHFSISKATFSYPSSQSRSSEAFFTLNDVSLSIPARAATLVCGPVASGKSLFLLGLLGEADVDAGGKVDFPRSQNADFVSGKPIEASKWLQEGTAYVPQLPWLRNATIRSNILFGHPLVPSRYQAVLDACSLRSDLAMFDDTDLTEIGERGVTLSGGQRCRVALARAVYSRARHVILDDILSAVDAHTAQTLVESCLQGPLMKDRTIVLVTHHVSLCLPFVQSVISLDNGIVEFAGDASSFASSPFYKGVLLLEGEEVKPEPTAAEDVVVEDVLPSEATKPAAASEAAVLTAKKPRKLIQQEKREAGSVSLDTYKMFLSACGGSLYWTIFAIIYVGTQLIELLAAWWLRQWTAATDQEHPVHSLDFYLVVYASILTLGIVSSALRWIVLYDGVTTRASSMIHRNLLKHVIRAPLRFFESTSHGTILNRFAADMARVDGFLPDDWARVVMYSLSLLNSLIVISVVSPMFLLAVLILAPIFWQVSQVYGKISRDLRRLDSTSLSPLFSLWSETIGGGITVIRSFGASQTYMDTLLVRIDRQIQRYYHGISIFLWLTTTFTVLNSILVGAVGFLIVTRRKDAALAGFSLTFALGLTTGLLDLVLRYISLELTMISVERIKEFSAPQNGPPEVTSIRPPAAWPFAGEVDVDRLTLGYAPQLPDVLHDVSFHIEPASKVGICGPTGSGKSTIALSFFRFIEARSGSITLDGIDIAKLGTRDLRSRLTIIPQDPSILGGTLRSVLDVCGESTDAEIFDALRSVYLLRSEASGTLTPAGRDDDGDGPPTTFSRSPFASLETKIAPYGSNLSQGEKQLLMLARALLRRSKLIILDEATSSVDFYTDHLITESIRENFSSSTLLVVAHRLRTIISFDKILYLSQGRVVEYDSPKDLLQDPTSHFFSLCQKTGEFAELCRLAGVDDGQRRIRDQIDQM